MFCGLFFLDFVCKAVAFLNVGLLRFLIADAKRKDRLFGNVEVDVKAGFVSVRNVRLSNAPNIVMLRTEVIDMELGCVAKSAEQSLDLRKILQTSDKFARMFLRPFGKGSLNFFAVVNVPIHGGRCC